MASTHGSGNIRRFKPELVESSHRLHKLHNPQDTDRPPSRYVPSTPRADSQIPPISQNQNHDDRSTAQQTKPGGTDKPRRFLPQPTEMSSRSSRKNIPSQARGIDTKDFSHDTQLLPVPATDEATKSSRPLPHPFEVNTSNGKMHFQETGRETKPQNEGKQRLGTGRGPRKFNPEPIETVKISRRQPVKSENASSTSSSQSTPRKFAPQLIETGKRSFRRAETLPTQATSRSVATDGLPRPTSPPLSRDQRLASLNEQQNSVPGESRFSYASLLQRQEGRRHSFRVPDLPAIPSNSSVASDNSDLPSLSNTPSASSESSANRLVAKNRSRESCDERFSGYLLSLAAQSAEKQLRDQALAAFPNEQDHQPVSHFAIDGDEEFGNEDMESIDRVTSQFISPDYSNFRRESHSDLLWELEEMRRHKEEAERRDLGVHKSDAHTSRFSAAAIATRESRKQADEGAALFSGWRRDLGLAKMRNAASPPMLGDDIVFPFSASPQGTASETDHHHTVSANQSESESLGPGKSNTGLWHVDADEGDNEKPGLWKGLCHKEEGDEEEHQFYRVRTGIATPRPDGGFFNGFHSEEDSDTDEMSLKTDIKSLDVSGGHQNHDISTNPIIVIPSDENETIENEFHDGFVTQVYNYLSLGYPSLARYFDQELSKISGIPVAELRKDDLNGEVKGHLVTAPGDNARSLSKTNNKIPASVPEKCMRWKALRLYINEWARQQPEIDLNNDESLDAWGVIERRGSWAV